MEHDKLIAEFMGWNENKYYCTQTHRTHPKWYDDSEIKPSHCFSICNCKSNKTVFHYDWSWDWLMPVVEKIESMGYFVKISAKIVSVSRDNKGNNDSYLIKAVFGDETKLQKTYRCVIETIKYINYLKNKNNNENT